MAWEENSRICLHMQLIAILSRIGVILSTCAQLERENIKFRLNSGRKLYIDRGGKLGRKVGSVKTQEQKKEQYHDIISYLKRGYSIRNVAKLTGKGISTVQRIKSEFYL